MTPQQINAYIPSVAYTEGKQEDSCPLFHEDLAVLEPARDYTALAARGLTLKASGSPRFCLGEQDFLEENLLKQNAVAVLTEDGILLVFEALFSATGLLLAVLPHGSGGAVAYALHCLSHRGILCSPTVEALSSSCNEAETVYGNLAELLSLCERICKPLPDDDFRLHCAHVARLAGCKANVTDLPVGHYPLHPGDHARWTAFLLCTFLSLRGDSAPGTQLHLEHADRREFHLCLSHVSEHKRDIPVTETLYRFLSLPVFSDYRLTREKNKFTIEAELRRQTNTKQFSASVPAWGEPTVCIELTIEL